MNAWERFRFFLTGKAVLGTKVLPWQKNQPQYLQENYYDMARGGYQKNELVYACINEISRAVPEAPLRIYDAEYNELPDHPLRRLIERPNPFLTEFELWELTLMYMYLSGNAYWEKVRSRSGQVVELYPLRPDRVQIVPDDNKYISGYIYEIGGQKYPIDVDDIIHFKFNNPLDDFLGQSPLRAALRQVSVDNEATDYAKSLLENSAIPGVVITTQTTLDDEVTERLKKKWMQKFGKKKRGEPAFLQEGMDIKTVGMTMTDLAFPDLRSISETRICAVFQVPPILVGANTGLQRSTFANYEEARKSFWQETISPLLSRLAQVANRSLMTEFEKDSKNRAYFDTSDVSALQSIHNERWTRVDKAAVSGWITVNEARTEVGFAPVTSGDVFLRNFNTVPVPEGEPKDKEHMADEPEPPPEEEIKSSKVTPLVQKKKSIEDELQVISRAFKRIEFAETLYSEMLAIAEKEMRLQRQDFMRRFNSRTKIMEPQTMEELIAELKVLRQIWNTRLQEEAEPTLEKLIENAIEESKEKSDESAVAELTTVAAVAFIKEYAFTFADRVSETSEKLITDSLVKGQLEGLTIAEQRDKLLGMFSDWTNRAVRIARTEIVRASNAGAAFTYRVSGIQEMRWKASKDACPFCASLDGQVVATSGGNFLKTGDSLTVETDAGPKNFTNNYGNVGFPPLHPNCRCVVLPF